MGLRIRLGFDFPEPNWVGSEVDLWTPTGWVVTIKTIDNNSKNNMVFTQIFFLVPMITIIIGTHHPQMVGLWNWVHHMTNRPNRILQIACQVDLEAERQKAQEVASPSNVLWWRAE